MNNFKKISLPVVIFLSAALLECPSLIRSMYFNEIALKYILLVVALLLFIVLIRHLTHSKAAEYLVSSVSILMIGNWSQPLLYFACSIKTEEDAKLHETTLYSEMLVGKIELFTFIAIVSVVAVWFAMKLIEKSNQKQWISTILCTFVCIGLSSVMLVFSDKDSNTSTVGGMQPAIVIMFILLYCFAAFLSKEVNIVQKIMYISCFAVMMALLVYKHETGIPLICFASCILMYLLLYPIPKLKFLLCFTVIPTAALLVLMIMIPGLGKDTLEKLTSRIFLDNTYQTKLAKKNLEYAGIFGSYKHDCNLSEASTDFSINTSIHFFGFLWATLFLTVFIIGCYKKATELSKKRDLGLISNLRSICFMTFCIIIEYNLLVNLGIAPVVGVQAIFCGRSLSIAILSGLLFGGMTYDSHSFKKILHQIKQDSTSTGGEDVIKMNINNNIM